LTACLLSISVSAAVLAPAGPANADQWEHQSSPWGSTPDPGGALDWPTGMAWVLGPDSTTIRSPVDTPQPTGLSWSIVPGGVADWINANKTTRPITDLGASGLSDLADYQAVLGGVIDEWARVCGITNLGYVAEDGSVLVGGIVDTDGDGVYITDRGPEAGVGHIRFMVYDSNWMNVAASATYIPEPGSNVDNAANHRKAGDVRFKYYAGNSIWGQEGQDPDTLYFRNIALHEVGHTLGFGHNNVSGSVMNVGYEWNLGAGDIEGALAIYGPIDGDINGDGQVDGLDLNLLGADWQSTSPVTPAADINDDGIVDGLDLNILGGNWQGGVPAPGVIPEPASLALLTIGAIAMLRRRHSA
jgi:hypothetical protein